MCNMSSVICHMSLFNLFQTVRERNLQFLHNLCVMCPVSHVRCHISLFISHVSHVPIFSYFVLQSVQVNRWRLSYQQGLFFFLFLFLIKNFLIPNIYFSRLVRFRSFINTIGNSFIISEEFFFQLYAPAPERAQEFFL